MNTLKQIWQQLADKGYETDKGSVHDYISLYEKILQPYRHTAKNILEVGLFNGHSLRLWEGYFTTAKVYGMDCSEQPHGGLADLRPMIKSGRHNIFILDAENNLEIEQHFKGIKFDFVCEDASHDVNQQLRIYEVLKPYLNKGAIYIIEDLQNLDITREIYENIDSEKAVTIVDRRESGRYDNCLVIIKDKI